MYPIYSKADVDGIDLDAASETVRATLKAQNFVLRLGVSTTGRNGSCFRWSSTHEARGVKVSGHFAILHTDKAYPNQPTGKSISVQIRTRYKRGTYNNPRPFILEVINGRECFRKWPWQEWLTGTVVPEIAKAKGEKVTEPLVKTKDGLATFPPLRFDRPTYENYIETMGAFKGPEVVRMTAFYKTVRVRSLATILPNLKVDAQDVARPGVDPWFLMTGDIWAKRSGATAEILVAEEEDGLVYYPVRNGRVTNVMRPVGTYIDFGAITELDEAIVRRAIDRFLG